jgi:hypothetical protein
MPPKGAAPGGPPSLEAIMQEVEGALPDGRFSVAVLQNLVTAINGAMTKILGPHAPQGQVTMPKMEGPKFDGKAPVAVILPALILLSVAAKVDPKYGCDPADIKDDSELRYIIAKLKKSAGDKKVAKMAQEPGNHPEPDADDMGGPSDGDADNMPAKGPPMKGPPKAVAEAM